MENLTNAVMTNREFYVAVAGNEMVDLTVREKAQELLDKLDASNAKRRAKASVKSVENAELAQGVKVYLEGLEEGTVVTAKEVAVANDLTSSNKAVVLLKALMETGDVEQVAPAVKSKPMGYRLVMAG